MPNAPVTQATVTATASTTNTIAATGQSFSCAAQNYAARYAILAAATFEWNVIVGIGPALLAMGPPGWIVGGVIFAGFIVTAYAYWQFGIGAASICP